MQFSSFNQKTIDVSQCEEPHPFRDGIHIVTQANAIHYADQQTQAYRLRYRVFVEEQNWQALKRADHLDIDKFDRPSAHHVMVIEGGKVVGYSRLLPTLEPHLLSDVYPELAGKPIPRAQDIYEWTRYCVAPEKRGGAAIGNVGSILLCGVLEYALKKGISKLTMETNPLWITRFFDFGFNVDPLGLPMTFDDEPVVAMSIEISEKAVKKCRRLLRIKNMIFETDNEIVSGSASAIM